MVRKVVEVINVCGQGEGARVRVRVRVRARVRVRVRLRLRGLLLGGWAGKMQGVTNRGIMTAQQAPPIL